MAHCLQQEGVTKVFGQCGHTNYALIDACHKLGIEYISFRHEQQAAHAADAYLPRHAQARRPQRPSLAGLDQRAHRRGDGRRRLARRWWSSPATRRRITTRASRIRACACTPTPRKATSIGRSASACGAIDDAKFLVDVMPRALNLAQTGRSGAVLLDMPMDVFSQHIDAPAQEMSSRRAGYSRDPAGAPDGIADAVQLLQSAKSPAIFAGNGVVLSEAVGELTDAGGAAGDAGRDHADGERRASRRPSARVRHVGHLGHARRQRNACAAPTSSLRSARHSVKPIAARGGRSTPLRFRRRG